MKTAKRATENNNRMGFTNTSAQFKGGLFANYITRKAIWPEFLVPDSNTLAASRWLCAKNPKPQHR
jgi:hypothetical protein